MKTFEIRLNEEQQEQLDKDGAIMIKFVDEDGRVGFQVKVVKMQTKPKS